MHAPAIRGGRRKRAEYGQNKSPDIVKSGFA